MESLKNWLNDRLLALGMSEQVASVLDVIILMIILLVFIFIIDVISRAIIRKVSSGIAKSSKTKFDDLLITNRLPRRVAHIIPLLLSYEFIPIILNDFPYYSGIALKILQLYGIILTLWIARALLNSIKDYLKTKPRYKDKPIDSFIQVFMIFAWFIGFFLALAVVTDIDLWKFITGLGAASAIILLVFKDTILGIVASIQVASNDMVRIGDWITFDKYGADGDVTEINLATVKVQNFDKTITTIPTYALISDSFKNWRGMVDSNGRRIKRSILIKQESIKFLDKKSITSLRKIQLISEYLSQREDKINTHNLEEGIDKSLAINGRNMTNIGVFRKYVEEYISQHSAINKDMMVMTRQLPPTAQGIPIEIYAFSADKNWQNYEYIIADIFDHVIASVPFFDLELFELPSSGSFSKL